MRRRNTALAGAFAATLALAGAAFAQSPAPGAAGQPANPGAPRPGVMPGAGGGVGATGATTPGTTAVTPAPGGGARDESRTAPLSGANSFTEGQAQSRLSAAGYADIQGLRLDERGVWRGRAMRNGQATGVALDYQGNVVATD